MYLIPLYPLVFWGGFLFPFIVGKMLFFYAITQALFALWILALLNGEVRLSAIRSPILITLTVFFLFFILSTITSVDPGMSFWSTFERMDGLLTWFHLGALFLVLSSVPSRTEWKRTLRIMVGVYTVVVVGTFLSLPAGFDAPGRIGSVFGNPAYFSTFVLLHLFLIGLLFRKAQKSYVRVTLFLLLSFGIVALLFAGTRGSVLGLLAGAGTMFALSSVLRTHLFSYVRRTRTIVVGLLAVALITVIFSASGLYSAVPLFNRTLPTSISSLSMEPRILLWQEVFHAVREKPLLGWGHGNFDIPFNTFYNPLLSLQESWFDHAHNVFLDWAVVSGVPLALAYLGLFVVAVAILWLPKRGDTFPGTEKTAFTGLLVAYLVNGLFLFDSFAGLVILIGVFAYIASGTRTVADTEHPQPRRKAVFVPIAIALGSATLVSLFFFVLMPAQGAYYARMSLDERFSEEVRLEAVKTALKRTPIGAESVASRFGTAIMQAAPSPAVDGILEDTRALVRETTLDGKVRRVPNLVLNGLLASRVGDLEGAVSFFEEARALSPNRKDTHRSLAEAYTAHGDFESAVKAYEKVYQLESLFPSDWTHQYYIDQAFKDYAVSRLYIDDIEAVEKLLKDRFGTAEIYDSRLIDAYLYRGRTDRVAGILEARLKEAPDGQVCFSLAAAYLKVRDASRSIETLVRCGNLFPETQSQAEALIEEIRRGTIDIDNL